jgi:hypothetical protein
VARMGEGKGVYRVLLGRSEGNRPLGRPRHREGLNGLSWLRIRSRSGLL